MPLQSSQSSLSSVPNNITAHGQLLCEVETRLGMYQPITTPDNTIPILKSLVRFLPRDGVYNVCNDILGCSSDEQLRTLAHHFLTALLAPFKSRRKTPSITPSPRFAAECDTDEIAGELAHSGSRKDQAWLKAACLERDGNRCVVTGFYDAGEAEKMDFTESELNTMMLEYTKVCHIIPFSLGAFSESGLRNSAMSWDAMYRCFPGIRARIGFSPERINEPCNAITMTAPLHEAFDKFKFVLEPTSNDHIYRIKTYRGFPTAQFRNLPENRLVTLTNHYPMHSLPHSILFGLHASIAQILHASGMGEYLEKLLRDRELCRFLAPDGTTDIESLFMVS
ncbi:hypothetical protein BDZ91DRAFT_549653 [Kalaharituber pfeilii]|nr:hypothetical protein BDZ91DRAFT_549653 [Kalaharituber pfeilii]